MLGDPGVEHREVIKVVPGSKCFLRLDAKTRLQRFEHRPFMIDGVTEPEIDGVSLEREVGHPATLETQILNDAVHLVIVLRNQAYQPSVLSIRARLPLIQDIRLDLCQQQSGFGEKLFVVAVALLVPVGERFPTLLGPAKNLALSRQSKVRYAREKFHTLVDQREAAPGVYRQQSPSFS